jgi:ATP-dependent DNA helicase PIF1
MAELNEKQKNILGSIENGKNAFITGFAGSGKSFLIEYICKINKKIALTAMTGCAALLINGKTLHSTLGIGLGKGEARDLVKKIRRREGLLPYLLTLEVLVIDEVSMLSDILFDKIAEIFKILHSSDKPFGKLQVILVGDLSQLKPVEDDYCFFAKYWDQCLFDVSVLTQNMRVNSDTRFDNLLQKLRLGKLTDLELIEKMKNNTFSGDILPTKLFSKNKDVDTVNNYELEQLLKNGNESISYKIQYSNNPIKLKESTKYTSDNKISEFLTICVGAQVMVTRNIDFESLVVNGTRGVVVSLDALSVTIKLISGELYKIWYYHVKPEDNKYLDFKYLPLSLSWAMSIHKSQGATIDLLEIDLGESIFAAGQMYVAISRARDSDTVRITKFNKKSIKVSKAVLEFYKKYMI